MELINGSECHGMNFPRATQAAWMIALADPLQPLINLIGERGPRAFGYVRIDETPMQVLKSEKRAEPNIGYGCEWPARQSND